MALYQPNPNTLADANAMSGTVAAIDRAFRETFGNGIISGLTLNTTGTISSGKALIGHILNEPGKSISSLFTGSGSFDLYAAVPVLVQTSGTLASPGTYPDGSGADTITYVLVPSGAGTGSTQSAMICTVTLSASTITSVNNAPSGRNNIITPNSSSGTITRLLTKESVFPGNLSAPLPVPLAFLVPTNMLIQSVDLAVLTAPVGENITVKIQKNGLDVWTSAYYPTIAAGTKTISASNPTGAYSCSTGDILTVDLTQVGSTTPGSTLLVNIHYLLN